MSKVEKIKDAKENVKSHTNAWLFFLGFVIYIAATTLPQAQQVTEIRDNREGIECLIQQLSEHRVNTRSADIANSTFHKYEFDIPETHVPKEIASVDEDICDKWLQEVGEPTTTQDVDGEKGERGH